MRSCIRPKADISKNRAYNTDAAEGVVVSTIGDQTKRFGPGKEIHEYLDALGQTQQRLTSVAAPTVTDFSCRNWTAPKDLRLVDYYIRDLANGVERGSFPSGLDKGVLTQVIEHVVDNAEECGDLKLSQLEWFVAHSGVKINALNSSFRPGMRNPDVEAFDRHKANLRQYRETMQDYRLWQKREQAGSKRKSQEEVERQV